MKSVNTINKQSGAVSLFVVIFAILLMSIVTISFLRIMTNDQRQASGNDLAQSAYDSAQAGVEDAKRALVWYTNNCTNGASAANCASFVSGLNACNASISRSGVVKAGDIANRAGGAGTGEILVQQSSTVDASGASTDKALDQAYTCVKMELDTQDYVGALTPGSSVLVPLVATKAFSTVTLEWFSRDDLSNATGSTTVPTLSGGRQPLPDSWPKDQPSLMRTQIMQVPTVFKLTDFDTTTASSQSNTNTLFLYPARSGFSTADVVASDVRKSPTGNSIPSSSSNTPFPTNCVTTIPSGGYSCKITLTLPTVVGGGSAAASYLRLTAMYVGTHYRVTLGDGARFKAVQPSVDSTGRANDIFRRVESRIDLYDTAAFPYPDGAVDTAGALCKSFGVTDEAYFAGSCTP